MSLQVEEEQWFQRFPHSATQAVRRTSVLWELTRMPLSEGRMSGMWPLGQQAGGPMARIVPPSVWRTRLPDSWSTSHFCCLLFWRSPEGVMTWPFGSASLGPPWPKHISCHMVGGGGWGHIWVCNIILSEFCNIMLTSTARNVSSLIFPTLPRA